MRITSRLLFSSLCIAGTLICNNQLNPLVDAFVGEHRNNGASSDVGDEETEGN